MKILYAEYIDDKFSELILTDDHVVIVKYDGRVISESGDETWQNIQDICELYVQFCIHVYRREEESSKERSRLVEDARRLGWNDIS